MSTKVVYQKNMKLGNIMDISNTTNSILAGVKAILDV